MTSFSRRQLEGTIEWMTVVLARHGATGVLAQETIPHEVALVLEHYTEKLLAKQKEQQDAEARRAHLRQAH